MNGQASQGPQAQADRRWRASFFTIWSGQAISLLGSRVAHFALVWWVTQATGSATVLATASMVALIPEILLGPLAGAYVDRWNRRLVMLVADALVALASLWLALLFWNGAVQVWHIYVIMLIRSLGGAFHWPAMQASTALMVPEEHLTRISGLNQTLFGLLSVAAPALGAALMALLPLGGVMMVDVGTACAALLPLLFVAIPQPERAGAAEGARPSIWADIAEGFRFLRGEAGLMLLIGGAMVVKVAVMPALVLMPLLVQDHFGGGAAALSLLETVGGLGMLAGGLALSTWGGFKRRVVTLTLGVIGSGLSMLVLGLLPSRLFAVAVAVNLSLGFMISLVDGPFMAIMQSVVTPEYHGRVFSLVISLLSLTSPIGLAVAGPVSDMLGLQIWFLAAGGMFLLLGGVIGFVPAVARLDDRGTATPPEAAPVMAEPSTVAD